MSDMIMRCIKPGMLTLVQDMGRVPYRHMGVPQGGAMDRTSARNANLLVGNAPDTPLLEITIIGPKLEFDNACNIAITGANISPTLNGVPIDNNKLIKIPSGAKVSFGRLVTGCRCYLAVGGHWQVDKWLGSASAFTARPAFTPQGTLQSGFEIVITQRAKDNFTDMAIRPLEVSSKHIVRVMKGVRS